MAELEPTEALVALLQDVADRKVTTNKHDCAAYLALPEGIPANVSEAVWAMETAGWIHEPASSVVWELTGRGREVLDRGAP